MPISFRSGIIGATLALLAGCVTTADLEGNDPSISAVTKKTQNSMLCAFS